MTPARPWGLSPCVPFLEEHSLTKLLLFFSFLVVPFPDSFSMEIYILLYGDSFTVFFAY